MKETISHSFSRLSSDSSFSDPRHHHSFAPIQFHLVSTLESSLFFFRTCLLCHDRLLVRNKNTTTILKQYQLSTRRSDAVTRKNGPSNNGICQCLNCNSFIHRECASFLHYHRHCRRHTNDEHLIPVCGQAQSVANAGLFAENEQTKTRPTSGKQVTRKTFTLATLIEELDSSNVVCAGANSVALEKASMIQQPLQTASKYAKKVAPLLAVGSVIGAIALGPAAAMLAAMNICVASLGMETVMAGIGLTASAAAATVTHQKKLKASQRKQEKLRNGEWAMEICWKCKENFSNARSDEACRKDAEFLRRFQSHYRRNGQESCNDDLSSGKKSLMSHETMPDDAEVYRFLFSMFASPGELLGQMNVQLCEAFRKRFTDRHKQHLRRPSFTGKMSSGKTVGARTLAKDTLQDTKMYIAHMLGATLQCIPSLACTYQSVKSCTLAVERIIYDDIYAIVFGEFQQAFQDVDLAFTTNLEDIRCEQKYHLSALLQIQYGNEAGGNIRRPQHAMLEENLQKAEAKMVTMMQETTSPLLKLVLLCDAFRSICWFAEKLHKSASNTDMLIPILCAFLVECPRVCCPGLDFVAEIAFISFFTNGGGKGVEGYVLTTFQAAIQVIAAVDLPSGHAMELELFINDDESEVTDETEVEGEKFYDAVSPTPRESQLKS